MITVKIADIVNGTEALQKLVNAELKAKLAWKVSKLLKLADQEIQTFNETRMDLIRKFGEKDENGELITDEKGNCKIPPENLQDFSSELSDLLNSEVELNANKIDIEELENVNFTPGEITLLEPFVNFEE